jgi:hypothetical protein
MRTWTAEQECGWVADVPRREFSHGTDELAMSHTRRALAVGGSSGNEDSCAHTTAGIGDRLANARVQW